MGVGPQKYKFYRRGNNDVAGDVHTMIKILIFIVVVIGIFAPIIGIIAHE